LFYQRRKQIPAGRGSVHHIQIAVSGIPQGHPIVMLAGDNGIFGSTFGYDVGPIGRIVVVGGKTFELFHVIRVRDIAVEKRPGLIDTIHGINAPMDKNSQLGILEPLHFILTVKPGLTAKKRKKNQNQNQSLSYHFFKYYFFYKD
jgi:hypothetical protein